jgi:hypothetical protein
MNTEQQRIAIAEACGWLQSRTCHWEGWWYLKKGKRTYQQRPPDYLNDLNAMHKAEKIMSYDEFDEYYVQLSMKMVRPFHATAAQRAEAFLRTLDLWKQ